MKHKKVSAQDIVDLLNRVLELDPVSLQCLISFRVPVSPRVNEESPVLVREDRTVGFLGLINGLFVGENSDTVSVTQDGDLRTGNKILRFTLFSKRPLGIPNISFYSKDAYFAAQRGKGLLGKEAKISVNGKEITPRVSKKRIVFKGKRKTRKKSRKRP